MSNQEHVAMAERLRAAGRVRQALALKIISGLNNQTKRVVDVAAYRKARREGEEG